MDRMQTMCDVKISCPSGEHINAKNILELLTKELSSTTSSSPIIGTENEVAKKFANEIFKRAKFMVSLCFDVLLEVLHYGNRLKLTKLERVGRRFHWIIENYLGEKPFIRLHLNINPRNEMKIFIIGNEEKEMSGSDLSASPRFIRFNDVKLFYNRGPNSTEETCRSIENYLRPLKEALKDANSIQFYGGINRNCVKSFRDHFELIVHLGDHLLPIISLSRRYKFIIEFYSDKEAASNVISAIFQLPQISRCSNLEILFYFLDQPIQLPVGDISNWLNRKMDGRMEVIGRAQREILLKIDMDDIQNVVEICDHLAKKFKEAKAPARPYKFNFEDDWFSNSSTEIEEKMLRNKKTEEVFSVQRKQNGYIEIELNRMGKKGHN